MTKSTIEVTMDWIKSRKHSKNRIKVTEYKNGVAQKPKYVKG
jgi:hypothetical protein